MEAELTKLQKINDKHELENYVQKLEINYICSQLDKIYTKENGALLLQLLFSGLSATTSCLEKRMKITRTILNNIEKKLVSPKLTEKYISVLATQMNLFSASDITSLMEYCLEMMKQSANSECYNSWKDFIPKLINKIMEEDIIESNGSSLSSLDYRSEVVIAICLSEWPDRIVTNIASMFTDISLSNEEHLKVVKKLCKKISSLNVHDIPPLIHHMLQLTKEKHFSHFFLALADVFEEKLYSNLEGEYNLGEGTNREWSLNDIQIIEGTVLYHIYSTVSSLGPQSVKDFLKILRDCVYSPAFILRPFCLTFLLTLSCVSYAFEEEILNIIKGAVVRNYAEEERIFDSAWINSVSPPPILVDKIFDMIIHNCFRERDKVLKGMVNLGFSLLAVPKTRGKESQVEKIWALGSSILVKIINKHADVTVSVLQTLMKQISQVHESSQYTDCLFHIVRKNPLNVLDCSTVLIQLLDNICANLPGHVGKRIVELLLPLTKMSHSLRDNLIIVLRKSLFPNNKACREMAVTGILELLKLLKISNLRNISQSISQPYCGLTQIYSDVCTGPGPSHSNEGLCMELLSMLRVVFKHQNEVKIVFYRGIYESVYANPELGCHALDNLQNQFDKFFKPGEDLPPLHFEKTVIIQGQTPILQEPIAELMFSIGLIAAKIEDGGVRSSQVRRMFDSISERMANSDIPHFTLGKDIFGGSVEGSVKEEEIRQILGVYEALIGYTLSTWTKDSDNHGQTLNSLFRGYCRLSDYARSLGKTEKKKSEEKGKSNRNNEISDKKKDKNKITPFRFPTTVLNFKCASRLLSILYERSITWASEQSTAVIRSKRELHRYCMNVILSLLKQIQLVPATELSRNKIVLGYMTKIGRVLLQKCIKELGTVKEFDIQTAVTCLECFSELIQLVLNNFKEKFSNFLHDICESDVKCSVNVQLYKILENILDQLHNILEDELEEEAREDEVLLRKLSLLLVAIANSLASQLSRGNEAQEITDKLISLSKDIKVKAPNVAKSILHFLLTLHMKSKTSGNLLLDLAFNLRDNIPLIDDEMKTDDHVVYSIINEKTANACVIAVCDALRFHVNQIDWIIVRLKAELLILSLSSKNNEEREHEELCEKEREVCHHINFIVKVLSILCTLAVPPGIYADAVLKEICNFYNKLTIITKYFIVKVSKYHHQLQQSKFDKTVKVVDHELSKNMYCFTEHVIADGTGSTDDNSSKKDPAFLKNKCLRETKIIPKVIYEKEQFQKFVLQLSNKSKIDLVAQTKYTMARDYRLYAKQVKEILEREKTQLEDMDIEEENTSQNEKTEDHRSKKQKLTQ